MPTRKRLVLYFWRALLLLALLGLWEYGYKMTFLPGHKLLNPFFISKPTQAATYIYQQVTTQGAFWNHYASTMLATGLGFVFGTTLGFSAGLYLSENRVLYKVFEPYLLFINAMPRIAVAPFLLLTLGTGLLPKVIMASKYVFFLTFFNTFFGGQEQIKTLVDSGRILGASKSQLLWTVRMPNALAWTFAGLPGAVSFALSGVVVQEFVASGSGLGFLMANGLGFLRAREVMLGAVFLAGTGLALVTVARRVEKRVLFWREDKMKDVRAEL